MVFGGEGYAEIVKRGAGLGVRIGEFYDQSEFTKGGDDDYISFNKDVNYKIYERFALFAQPGGTVLGVNLDEELYGLFFTGVFFDFQQAEIVDMPPTLDGVSWPVLINNNDSNGDIEIKSSQTLISKFKENYPQYSSIISQATEPTLSADFSIRNITIGPKIGITLPLAMNGGKARHRALTAEAGLGIGFVNGNYSINVCDPYIVSSTLTGQGLGTNFSPDKKNFRRGVCSNKRNLYKKEMSNIGFSRYWALRGYSYLGDKIEINLLEYETYKFQPIFFDDDSENVIKPRFNNQYYNIISFLLKL